MKYYAIRTKNGEPFNKIFTTWDECKQHTNGNHCEYKSFKTEKEAIEYLGSYEQEQKEEDIINTDNYIYYVDGSYLNDIIGWGFVLTKHNEEITRMSGCIKPIVGKTSRNISGELTSCIMATRHAISNGIKEIFLVNDYQGNSAYVTGAWKPKTEETKQYLETMNELQKYVKINWIKVKGHTSNKWNDEADLAAKLGTKLV